MEVCGLSGIETYDIMYIYIIYIYIYIYIGVWMEVCGLSGIEAYDGSDTCSRGGVEMVTVV
jgi:hypothetical protein